MIIPVKKNVKQAGHIDAKLIDFREICQQKSSETGCFLLIVSWRSFPRNFPWNRPIFLRIYLWKSFRNLTFFRKNPAEFFREISEALAHQNVFGASWNDVWLVTFNVSFSLPKWQAVKMTFFAPCAWDARLVSFHTTTKCPLEMNIKASHREHIILILGRLLYM